MRFVATPNAKRVPAAAVASHHRHAPLEAAVMGAKSRRKGNRGEREAAAEIARLFQVTAARSAVPRE